MALIDKASLLMVPSTYEAGKLYNVLPSGNRAPDSTDQNSGYDQTRADFDFDRGSNAAATRIGSDGLIKKYRENLLVQSNAFDTTWINYQSAETGGQPDKDGGNTAWKLTRLVDGANSVIYQTGLSYSLATFSVYAKAAEENWIYIEGVGSTYPAQFFDLQNGVKGTASGVGFVDSSITSVGSGWYRISITFNISGGNRVSIYQATANNTLSGSIGDGVYIMNAQVEKSLVASSYLDSTSVTGKAGVLVDLPRINYDANGENGALLLEPSRANLVTQSEVFDIDTAFIPSGRPSVEKNVIISPEGLQNATRLSYGVGNSLRNGPEFTFANAYTYSIFVKKDVGRYVTIYAAFFTTSAAIGFDLDEGTCQAGGVIEPYGNDWYRISVSKSVSGDADKSGYFYLYSTDALGSTISKNGNKLYVWGNQIEEGNYVSSYIPTMGTSETRAADSCSVTGVSDVIGQTEGTMFFELTTIANSQYKRLSLNNGSYTNSIVFDFQDNNVLIAKAFNGGIPILSISSSVAIADIRKIAIAYKNNDYAFYVNGSLMGTLTSIVVPSGLSAFGFDLAGNQKFEGNIKQALLFKERLTNAELATLTTL